MPELTQEKLNSWYEHRSNKEIVMQQEEDLLDNEEE